MRLRITRAGRSADVTLTLPDASTPLAELLRAAGVDPVPTRVSVDGRGVFAGEPVGALALHDGSAVDLDGRRTARPAGPVQLVQVAGGASGECANLPVGLHDVGPAGADGRVQTPVVRIGVEASGTLTLATVGRGELRLDGVNVAGPVLEPVRAGLHVGTADTLLRLGPGPAAAPRPGAAPHAVALGPSGRLRYQRTPTPVVPPAPPPPVPPDRPLAAQRAPQVSWAMVLAPIPIAVVMALVLDPHFLIFAAFTPVLALARWAEGAWRQRRADRLVAARRAHDLAEYEATLAGYAAARSVEVRAATPDLAALTELARTGGPGLWAARPGSEGFLRLPVGYGDLAGGWEVPPPRDGVVHELAVRYRRLPDVPVFLDLGRHAGAGFVGPEAAGLVASALAHAAATHGPAHLQVAVVCDPDRAGRWDWLKWLPHRHDPLGRVTVATNVAQVTGLFGSGPPAEARTGRLGAPLDLPGPVRIVVVDSEGLVDAVLARLSGAPDRAQTRLCVVAAGPERLPSICTQVVTREGGRLSVADLTAGRLVRGVLPVCAAPRTVSALARRLARYVDPEAVTGAASLPDRIDLAHLLGSGFGVAETTRRWAGAGQALVATVGATEEGPLHLDLIADGPHMLVAGTTGSGKSELLRTLVTSLACRYGPDRVNFVLVDFKGGGAFDACADLPHTAGVVTDLDEQLAARALRCLRAEVRHRERVLRAAGVSDLGDLAGPDVPARLLLVIDEFATLATELPSFLGSLVDIAQRGRSLGVHLVLATQRPSGVVDSKIRANTNLRIALRVQTDADSHDVLASPAACRIDRRTPGRGYVLFGAGELRAFQTALVSTHTPATGPVSVRAEPFTLLPPASPPATPAAASASAAAPTDLQQVVVATRATAADRPPIRVPWPAPLPDRVDAESVWAGTEPVPGTVQLGLVDRPDDQRVDAFRWDHRRGPLLAYGSEPAATTGVIVTAAADLARHRAADALHLYLFDLVPGTGLERVAGLPHVAVRVVPGDHERLLRAVDALERELDRRRDAVRFGGGAGDAPLILVGIAGYHHAMAVAEELGRLDLPSRLERLIAEGGPLGVAAVLTTHHERGVPSRLASQIHARIAFRLADPNAYTGFGLRPRAVPDLRACRAVDLASGDEVVIATPEVIVSAGRGAGGPRPVENLPDRVEGAALAGRSRLGGPAWQLAVGLRHSDLSPVVATLHPGSHLVVTGGPASGRTTTLRTLAAAVTGQGGQVRVLTGRPGEWAGGDGVRVGLDALADPVTGPTLVVVDGLDAAAASDPRLTALADDPLVRIVVTDRVDAFRLPATWLRKVLASRAAVLLRPQPDHGDLVRVRLPTRGPVAYPPGRGYLVENGFAELVQVALPDDSATRSLEAPNRVTARSETAWTSTASTTQSAANA